MSKPREDMTGAQYGRLLVVEIHHVAGGHGHWLCLCDPKLGGCGEPTVVRDQKLEDGLIVSCGCWRADPAVRLAARLKTPAKRRKQIAQIGARMRNAPGAGHK